MVPAAQPHNRHRKPYPNGSGSLPAKVNDALSRKDMANLLNQVTAVQLAQRLDHSKTEWLSQEVDRLRQAKSAVWVLDMAAVDFVDSAGLISLVATRQAAYEANAQVILCGVSQPIRMILDLAQLDQVFAIVESLEVLPSVLLPRNTRSEARLAA
jgi:anti-sigma B factor antagonist